MNAHRLRQYFLLTWLSFCSAWVSAERYHVTEDSFGSYSAEPVEQTKKQPSQSSSELSETNQQERVWPLDEPEEHQHQTISEQSANEIESSQSAGVKKPLSVFEQKYLEAEKKARKQIIKRLEQDKGAHSYDATKVDEVDFVDSEALLGQGSGSQSGKSRFFTTVDVDGTLTNIPYDPLLEKAAWDKFRNQKKIFTEAIVYRKPTASDSGKKLNLPDNADPVALQILNVGGKKLESYFDTFSQSCCANLPNARVPELSFGRSHSFSLSREYLPYRFNEGDSRYLLLRLPEQVENYPLQIRTFIRKYKKRSVDHGVFFPQLVTLDAEKQPLRIITGPLLKYVAETWASYGYLEGIFEIDRTEEREEHYILINTTREVLSQSSVIEEGEEPIQITHMATGLFEVKLPTEE